ncbi:MAG: hypothetical protein AB7S38_22610 [Vulcanimicrobiota bacterium]
MRRILLLLLVLATPAVAGQRFAATFANLAPNGQLVLKSKQGQAVAVSLAGLSVSPGVVAKLSDYCDGVLVGRALRVELVDPQARSGVVYFQVGPRWISLNKQLLVDGYATVTDSDPLQLAGYQEKGRQRQVGLWGQRWVRPHLEDAAPQMTDRDRMIAMYGLPSFSRRNSEADQSGLVSYHVLIEDFYIEQGMVLRYRDGILLNKQAYNP